MISKMLPVSFQYCASYYLTPN
ncbi:Uncharacterized protein GY17_00002290 [Cryptosporidium hominis]|uniref:Uncharacterized protein n=1 Tax=Cryptosporidium hominis TaxID=237895 RepID=A0ABX5BE53_CRYHO|nr:Uncharacterized protein GY17_00002290 [Cryptosporidium hominis]|eukprot:PPS95688.1 Uncharacterized protein GY17_00002290 [Cryptosporidium hominis]